MFFFHTFFQFFHFFPDFARKKLRFHGFWDFAINISIWSQNDENPTFFTFSNVTLWVFGVRSSYSRWSKPRACVLWKIKNKNEKHFFNFKKIFSKKLFEIFKKSEIFENHFSKILEIFENFRNPRNFRKSTFSKILEIFENFRNPEIFKMYYFSKIIFVSKKNNNFFYFHK